MATSCDLLAAAGCTPMQMDDTSTLPTCATRRCARRRASAATIRNEPLHLPRGFINKVVAQSPLHEPPLATLLCRPATLKSTHAGAAATTQPVAEGS